MSLAREDAVLVEISRMTKFSNDEPGESTSGETDVVLQGFLVCGPPHTQSNARYSARVLNGIFGSMAQGYLP